MDTTTKALLKTIKAIGHDCRRFLSDESNRLEIDSHDLIEAIRDACDVAIDLTTPRKQKGKRK